MTIGFIPEGKDNGRHHFTPLAQAGRDFKTLRRDPRAEQRTL